MNKCDHGLTTRLAVCPLCADELRQRGDEWEMRWRKEAIENTRLSRELAEAQDQASSLLATNYDLRKERDRMTDELAEARVRREPLMKLLEYCAVSEDMQYGTVSTALVRDLVLEATAADQPGVTVCMQCGGRGTDTEMYRDYDGNVTTSIVRCEKCDGSGHA